MKGENKAGYLIKAVLCGFLVAFNVVLFLNYFTDIKITGPSWAWFIAVDIGFVFLVAYPFEEKGVIPLTIFLLILGYAAYGPYATYLRGPMGQISESLSDMPKMAEKQMHCLMLIFTNPMAYQTECVLTEQQKAHEEKPEQYGLEITNFDMQPEKKIYPGMPFMIRLTLKNKGDYPAGNVKIKTTAGEYERCKIPILKNLTPENGTKKLETPILPETGYLHAVSGIIEDPWTKNCTYAKNKAIIGGTITTTYSYDYKTESFLENIEIIKNVNETEAKLEVKSAKEKAAPATILMYTFVPLIWEGAEDYRSAIIPISLKNERKDGTIVFRGKYEFKTLRIWKLKYTPDWLADYGLEKLSDLKAEGIWNWKEEQYDGCVVSTTGEEMKDIVDENVCVSMKGVPQYKKNGENIIYDYCIAAKIINAKDEKECKEKGGLSLFEPSLISKKDVYSLCINESTKREIEANETECKNAKGEQIYKARAKRNRREAEYDKITIKPIGEAADYVSLSCGGKMSDESDIASCTCLNNICEIKYTGEANDLKIRPNQERLLYELTVSLVGDRDTPWPEKLKDATKISFLLHADATYSVELSRSQSLQIRNPHYEK